MRETTLPTPEPKKHRPSVAACLAALAIVFYWLSISTFSTVHYIVVSSGFGAILLSIIWFSMSALFADLAYEFHAKRAKRRTVSTIVAVLLAEAGAITTGGISVWLAVRLPHSSGGHAVLHLIFVLIWAVFAIALFGTALHIIDRHTKRKKKNEAQAKRVSASRA